MENVLSFRRALNMGYNPREYDYEEGILCGEFMAVLDFMIWSDHVLAINLYFTLLLGRKKIVLSAYADQKQGGYRPRDGGVDFTSVLLGSRYSLRIGRRTSGKMDLLSASPLAEDAAFDTRQKKGVYSNPSSEKE